MAQRNQIPIQEIRVQQGYQSPNPPRAIYPQQQQQADDQTSSAHSSYSYQSASVPNYHQRQMDHPNPPSIQPDPHYQTQQTEVNLLRNNLSALADTVHALQADIRNINSSNQRTEARLTSINETNNKIIATIQANTEALRSFIHGDIQPIIESHVETTLLGSPL